ncbi:hypothetical protein [Polymorphospora rubra]|uniref:Uncharacterized protein n=1 Tax=Polymorphospora rubra TaxID=338584 RepID=A0A810MTS3_9ACTN|nr:hypothetical protein [Polymorphospora rubra]BCJ64481.1 hypothetical protein Prubr_15020 [Polymorphospora rubra]
MKAHRTDGVSLTFALIFLGLAGWWLVAQIFHLALPTVGWFLASGLILLGVFGLIGALRSSRATPAGGEPDPVAPTSGGAVDPVSGAPYEPVTAPPADPEDTRRL